MRVRSGGPSRDEDEQATVVVDAYCVKVALPPSDLGEESPTSWGQVREQIRGHLLRIASAPTRLFAEVLEGATRLVRGVSSLPSATASRLRVAHQKADLDEQLQQQAAVLARLNQSAAPDSRHNALSGEADEAVERVKAILEKARRKGLDGYLVIEPDGKVIVVVGTPTSSENLVRELLEHVRAEPTVEEK